VGILQNLHRNDQSVLQKIIVHKSIEDVDAAIIAAAGKDWVLRRESHLPDSLVMVLQVPVRLRSHIHIEPNNLLVVGTKDEVIALGVNVQARNPLSSRLVLTDHTLLLQIVLEDSLVGGSEEVGSGGVEADSLDDAALGGSEGSLAGSFTQRMDHHLQRGLQIVYHSSQVVSFGVPDTGFDDMGELELDHLLLEGGVFKELPLKELFLLVIATQIQVVLLFPLLQDLLSLLIDLSRVESWL